MTELLAQMSYLYAIIGCDLLTVHFGDDQLTLEAYWRTAVIANVIAMDVTNRYCITTTMIESFRDQTVLRDFIIEKLSDLRRRP